MAQLLTTVELLRGCLKFECLAHMCFADLKKAHNRVLHSIREGSFGSIRCQGYIYGLSSLWAKEYPVPKVKCERSPTY